VSQERLDDVRKEVAALQDELQPLLSRYNKERARLQELRRLRKKREDLQVGGWDNSDTRLAHQLMRCACHSRSRASSKPAAAAGQSLVWYAAQSRGLTGWPGRRCSRLSLGSTPLQQILPTLGRCNGHRTAASRRRIEAHADRIEGRDGNATSPGSHSAFLSPRRCASSRRRTGWTWRWWRT
jgi:hypothetical protein